MLFLLMAYVCGSFGFVVFEFGGFMISKFERSARSSMNYRHWSKGYCSWYINRFLTATFFLRWRLNIKKQEEY